MHNDRTKTGIILKNIRDQLGITQGMMAHTLGVCSSYLSMIERGHRRMPIRLLKKLKKYYNIPEKTYSKLLAEVYTYKNNSGRKPEE